MTTLDKSKPHWRYKDYEGWPDDQRWELIDGVAYDMSPAPGFRHQEVVSNIHYLVRHSLSESRCRVVVSPLDVLLPASGEKDETVDNVVQPDVMVVCDQDKITEKYIRGAPDLVVEVLSPSTAKKDESTKRDLYERAGVAEYWLVHPVDHVIHRYSLENGRYGRSDVYGLEDSIVSTRFSILSLALTDVFGVKPQPMPQPGEKR